MTIPVAMTRIDSMASLKRAKQYVGVSACFTTLMVLVLVVASSHSSNRNIMISAINDAAHWNQHAVVHSNNRLQPLRSARILFAPPAEQGLRRRLLEQQHRADEGGHKIATPLSKLKISLSGNNSQSLALLSTIEELADKTKDINGDFVELGSLAPPAIIAQTAWRANGQKSRKSVLIAGSTIWGNNETSQRSMFEDAGILDSNVLIVDDFVGTVRQNVDAIAMLFMNQFLLEDTIFYELYDRVPMGGYVIVDQWRNDLFVDPIPGIVLAADDTIAYWEKAKSNEELYLRSRASMSNERQKVD